MNLHSIIPPGDIGGFGAAGSPASLATSSPAVQQFVAGVDAARSAHVRTNMRIPSSASRGANEAHAHRPSDPPRKRRATAAPKPKPRPSGARSTRPPAQSQSASPSAGALARNEPPRRGRAPRKTPQPARARKPQAARAPSAASSRSAQSAQEARTRVQAVADLCSVARGQQVSIMDVVLDAQSESAAGDGPDEELLDALEERQRIAMHELSDEDAVLEMLSTRWYGVRQARKWPATLVPPVDCSSSRIYHISAERSTAAWDDGLDSDGASSLDSYDIAPQYTVAA